MNIRGISGRFAGQEFPVAGGIVIGRSSQGCNVIFPDNVRGVSRTHCKVEATAQGLTITDLGSSNGTFLNGNKLQPNVPSRLNSGDTFWVGDKENSFTVSGQAVPAQIVNSAPPMLNSSDFARPAPAVGSRNKTGLIIGAIAAAAVVIALVMIIMNLNNKVDAQNSTINAQNDAIQSRDAELNRQQDKIDAYNNKSNFEKVVDGVEGFFDIIH
ncbi:MAG: FHA domain-containing protein [Lachnospiraceae bacterium]|nr:FHA domain-containing protein [Lachnospiraceae bacterium]